MVDKKIQGRILKGVGGNYQVLIESGCEITAKPRGILRKEKMTPYPGDIVDLSFTNDEVTQYNIDHIYERKSFLIRPAIGNLELIIITCSACDPKPDCFLVDKLLILCTKACVSTALCITKADLDKEEAEILYDKYKKVGIPIFIIGDDEIFEPAIKKIRELITGKIVSFAGQSGVGKSTLLNIIMGKNCMDIGKVSEKIGRGKHTTRHSEIFVYENGYLADTPGFSSLELEELEVTGEDVLKGFPEIAKFEGDCHFTGCRHIGEKGCAIDENEIDKDRLSRYRFFRKQMDAIQPYELLKKKK